MTPFSVLIGKWGKLVFGAAIFAMLLTIVIVPKLPRHQDVSIDITIPVPARQATTNYEYDGYYALQATDLFGDTLAGWFKSPDFVAQIFSKAGLSAEINSLRNLEKFFTVKKVSGQLITVGYSVKDDKSAGKIGEAIVENVNNRVEIFNKNGNKSLFFTALVGKPLIVLYKRDKYIDALIAGVIVLVFGFNLVIIVDALKNNNNKD